MTNVARTWFAKGSSGSVGKRASQYFIDNNCVSCGWSMGDIESRKTIKNLDKYKEIWHKEYGEKWNWGNQGVKQLFENLKKGDYIWTRNEGIYYLAKIEDDPTNLFHFDTSQDALAFDCSARLDNVKWKMIGTEEAVPGSISTYSRNQRSLIRKDNYDEVIDGMTLLSRFSAYLLGEKVKFSIKDGKDIFKYLDPNNIEDLCALWLYKLYGYIVIPSTNKLSTEKYEFVLVDPKSHSQKLIYIQVKNGMDEINPYEYKRLLNNELDELWLFATRGKIKDIENKDETIQIGRYKLDRENLYLASKHKIDDLVGFAKDKSNRKIIPKNISHWIDKMDL